MPLKPFAPQLELTGCSQLSSPLAEPLPPFPVLRGPSLFTFGWFHYEHDSHTAQTRGPMSGSDSGQTVADV